MLLAAVHRRGTYLADHVPSKAYAVEYGPANTVPPNDQLHPANAIERSSPMNRSQVHDELRAMSAKLLLNPPVSRFPTLRARVAPPHRSRLHSFREKESFRV
eukprot:5841784-Pleurochrysis_carterae.AAC.1